MSRYQTEVRNLTYNAATQSFEALVIFHEGPDRRSFPCIVALPLTAGYAKVNCAVVAQAKSKRAAGLNHLIARSPAAPHARLHHLNTLARQLSETIARTEQAA